MRKIGVVTFHFVNNFGGALQTYALRRILAEKIGVDAEVVDYRNWFIRLTDLIRMFPVSANVSEIVSGFKTMQLRVDRRCKFERFMRTHNKLSRRYNTYRSLRNNPPKDDKYICGSDQIWNPFITMGISLSYFLEFENNPNNKIAYAPSFGSKIVKDKYKKRISKSLNSIGYLSVREKSGQAIIHELTRRESECLIDPTFLLEKHEWETIGVNPIESEEPYILLYIMQHDMGVYEYARRIKEEKKIKLVEISRYGYNPGFVDETLVSVGPDEFLGLVRDADYICTNSYHGLAYSIIFEKEFCLIPSKKFAERINNLMELLSIDYIYDENGVKSLTASYDQKTVRDIINRERRKSLEYLNKSIEL